MSIKGKIEAIIYAAEEPVTLDQIAEALKEAGALGQVISASEEESPRDSKAERTETRTALRKLIDEISAQYADNDRGMEIRQVAGRHRMSLKPEHDDRVHLCGQ